MGGKMSNEYHAQWRREHPWIAAAWVAKNLEKVRGYKRKWKRTHRDKHLAGKRRWRARRSGIFR
jgi:hypothetical protein